MRMYTAQKRTRKWSSESMTSTVSNGNEVIVICDDDLISLALQGTCWIDSSALYHVTS